MANPVVAGNFSVGTMTIRMQPGSFVGVDVLHCHFVHHEDEGCMKVVEFLCPGYPKGSVQPEVCDKGWTWASPGDYPLGDTAKYLGTYKTDASESSSPEAATPGPALISHSAAGHSGLDAGRRRTESLARQSHLVAEAKRATTASAEVVVDFDDMEEREEGESARAAAESATDVATTR